jgi:small subunit ribosomal protein S4e
LGKKGKQQHLKRLPAPKFWPIHRKEAQWIVKPRPGPHKIHQCIPLILIVRDMLQLVKSRREAKIVLSEGQVKVDGKIRKNDDYPVGLMDVIEIPVINASYRVLPAPRKGLILHSITGKESESKLYQIINKTTVTGGHLQLNLHDGRNILCKVEDPKNPEEDIYSTHDILQILIPDMEITAHLKFEEGVLALITGGKNIGRFGEVTEIERRESPQPQTVTLEMDGREQVKTIIDYVFAIGRGMPWISLPEENES